MWTGFARREQDALVFWVGQPDSNAAHAEILNWLNECAVTFLLPPVPTIDNILKGNLGESIAFHVGRAYAFGEGRVRVFAPNALNPFSRIASAGVDIVWVLFSDNPALDLAILQEVKTTGDPSLPVVDVLLEDYDKLFGTSPSLTLWSRLSAIRAQLRFAQNEPDLAKRVLLLAGNSPITSPRIKLKLSLQSSMSSRAAIPLHD